MYVPTAATRTLAAVILATVTILGPGPRHALAQRPTELREAARPRPGEGILSGTVRSRFDRRVAPLAWAMVEVTADDVTRTVLADSVGRYEVRDLPVGALLVRASHAGHAPVETTVLLSASGQVDLDMELRAVPVEVRGVDVATGLDDPVPVYVDEPSGRSLRSDPELAFGLLQLGPGLAESGLTNAVRTLSGSDPADPTDVLFMRGSTTELKLVLLDGVPVVTPFHVGGLLRSFDPGTLASARFHVGGAPARYDGGLTHILDLRTRAPRTDRVRLTGSLDLLSAATAAEIPLGDRVGILATGRWLHDAGQASMGGERPYGYGETLITMEARPSHRQRVRGTAFWNRESVRLAFADGPAEASWGNRAVTARWEGEAGGAGLSVTAGVSAYDARMPFRPPATDEEPAPADVLAEANTERARVVAESTWGSGPEPVRVGLSFEDLSTRFTAAATDGSARTRSEGRRAVAGAFADVGRQVGSGVTLRGGLRADVFEGQGVRLSPRASVSWTLVPTALLTVAAGRYHQTTPAPVSGGTGEGLTSTSAGDVLPVASADHVVLSLDQQLATSVGLGLEGFWKRFRGVGPTPAEPLFNSGVDLRIRSSGPRVGVWLGYGLSWFWSATESERADFAGRHLLSAGVSGVVAGPVRAEATVAYGAGLPSTGIPFRTSAPDSQSDPGLEPVSDGPAMQSDDLLPPDASFLRLDLEVWADFRPEWNGHRWRLRPYLRLLNPLDRRDALFYTYQPGDTQPVTPLTARPTLPILGIVFSY